MVIFRSLLVLQFLTSGCRYEPMLVMVIVILFEEVIKGFDPDQTLMRRASALFVPHSSALSHSGSVASSKVLSQMDAYNGRAITIVHKPFLSNGDSNPIMQSITP